MNVGDTYWAWGEHYRIVALDVEKDGEPAVRIQNINKRKDKLNVIRRLLDKHGVKTDIERRGK